MYRHGIYGNILPSKPQAANSNANALPVYVGTAPVNTVSSVAPLKPVIVSSLDEAATELGYSEDWTTFTLCEAMKAHFDNSIGNIGPIAFINVFDPSVHKKAGTVSITPVNKLAWIDKETVDLGSIAIATKTKGTDYTAEYATLNGRNQVKITDKTAAGLGSVTVTFNELDITKVDETAVVGTAEGDARTGLQAIDLIYPTLDIIPGIIAAPGWSHKAQVYNAMDAKCRKINGKWEAIGVADIDATAAVTRAAAKTWKETNQYASERIKVCWPMTVSAAGKEVHLSTQAVVAMMRVDAGHSNIPFESPSNKPIDCSAPVLADGTAVQMDELDANDLNASGITTVNRAGGVWRLWGSNMGNYSYLEESSIRPENMFDTTVRMQLYLVNALQENFLNDVDSSATARQVQSVVDSAQPWLNGLVSVGALQGAEIAYNPAGNPSSETLAGRFRFSVHYNDVRPMVAMIFDVMRDGTLVAGGAK